MTSTTTLIIAGVAGLIGFWIVMKLVKAVVKAVIVAALLAAGVYFLLPALAEVEGSVGHHARETKESLDTAKETTVETVEKAKAAGRAIQNTAGKAKEALDGAAEATEGIREGAGELLE